MHIYRVPCRHTKLWKQTPSGLCIRREAGNTLRWLASGQLGFPSWLHLAYGRERWHPAHTGLLSKDEMFTPSLKPSHYRYILLLPHSSIKGEQKGGIPLGKLGTVGFQGLACLQLHSWHVLLPNTVGVSGWLLPVLRQLPAWGSWRWAEGAGDPGTPWRLSQPSYQPPASTWYVSNSNFSQYLQADCWQGPGTSWRWLETWRMWKGTGGTKGALYGQKFRPLRDRNGVETETTRELMLLPFFSKGKKKRSTHSHLCVLRLIQCNMLRHY